MKKEVKFILDKPNSNSATHIFLMYSCKDGRLKYSTQQLIEPTYWDFDEQKANIDRNLKRELVVSNRKINSELDRLFDIVLSFKESCRLKGKHDIYKEELKKELDYKEHRIAREIIKQKTFFTYVDQLIIEAKEGLLLTPNSKKYTNGSITNWKISKEKLKSFNPSLQFDQISLDTYYEFIAYCNKKGYCSNYIDKLIKDWKTFMALAHSKNWHSNLIYKHPKFKRMREESEQVYLNEKEIDLLTHLDLSNSSYLEKIRDRFIINLFTGLRASDMKSLTLDHFQEGNIVHINKKTGKKVVIPIHPKINLIIQKYGGNLPKQYTEQVVNREIKLIAKQAGIDEKISFTKTIAGIKQTFIKEKWQMISIHTGRRSLISNLLKHADVIDVLPVVGMTIKTISIYNKRTAFENAEMLKNNKFFQI